ncbi:MAG: hypothetical protein F4099_05055 [Synechococcus sp. SB0673_bin_10]|nr:hypothetical protein [Cyanobacteria bacterium MAG IRC3_bin_20]MCY3653516.1 hypothetical protein [Cyanobacteria bacterium MAG IRC1_bin_28]MDE0647761.1 hypothetical protein [Cyanobacteria bacterium MAG IRC4_bin_6]MXX09689.1 hypothetical protein [Synechococcus sp. SB0667_bin_8]MYG63955.1 hypothetical protein [Synechococcus sp. SB0675_bin_7]MYI71871.1 hypothetical protein [Synechococcus sp. SB0673_bin_10]MYK86575.1 hypothetical protein [Synechococcus sp. SB0669_bin_7]
MIDAAKAKAQSFTPPSIRPSGTQDDPALTFSKRYDEAISKINASLDTVDWEKAGRIGAIAGILLVLSLALVLVNSVLATIHLIPVLPGLLQLLGLVVTVQWCYHNLYTKDKRQALVERLRNLRKEYLG